MKLCHKFSGQKGLINFEQYKKTTTVKSEPGITFLQTSIFNTYTHQHNKVKHTVLMTCKEHRFFKGLDV